MAQRNPVTLHPERPLRDLLSDLSHDVGLLLRQEVELAKREIGETVDRASKDAQAIAIGGAVTYAGVLCLIAAVVLGLIRLGAAPWASALIVGGVFAVAGFMMLRRGRSDLAHTDFKPARTAEMMKQNATWVKEQFR